MLSGLNEYLDMLEKEQDLEFQTHIKSSFNLSDQDCKFLWNSLKNKFQNSDKLSSSVNIRVFFNTLLKNNADHNLACEVYEFLENVNIQIEDYLLLLDFLWSEGQVKLYSKYSFQILNRLLLNKNLCVLPIVIEAIKKKRKFWPKVYFVELCLYALENDQSKVISIATFLRQMIEEKWNLLEFKIKTKKEYHLAVYSILESIELKNLELEVFFREYEIFIWNKFDMKRPSQKKCMETIVLSDSNLCLLGAMALKAKDKIQEDIIQVLKTQKDFSFGFIKKEFPELLGRIVPVSVKLANEEKEVLLTAEDLSVDEVFMSSFRQTKEDIATENKRAVSSSEKVILKSLELNGAEQRPIDLAVFCTHMGFDEVLQKIYEKNKDDKEIFYIYCERLLKRKRSIEVISLLDLALIEKNIREEDYEFLYLKAEALWMLNKNLEAKEIYQKILLVNGSYRLCEERLDSV